MYAKPLTQHYWHGPSKSCRDDSTSLTFNILRYPQDLVHPPTSTGDMFACIDREVDNRLGRNLTGN